MNILFSALIAGVLSRVFCYPLDTIKTIQYAKHNVRDQCGLEVSKNLASSKASFSDFRLCCSNYRAIFPPKGNLRFLKINLAPIRKWFNGMTFAALGAGPGVALYLCTYNTLKSYLLGISSTLISIPPSLTHLLCGFMAEVVSCIVWVPVDLVKERLQSQMLFEVHPSQKSLNARGIISSLLSTHGLKGIYKGYFATLASFGPFSAIYFFTYEKCMAFSKRFQRGPVSSSKADMTENSTKERFWQAMLCGAIGNCVASVFTNPFELLKTRLQLQGFTSINNQPKNLLGSYLHEPRIVYNNQFFNYQYSGFFSGLRKILIEEGIRGLWQGTLTRIAFTAPNAALSMGIFEALIFQNKAMRKTL